MLMEVLAGIVREIAAERQYCACEDPEGVMYGSTSGSEVRNQRYRETGCTYWSRRIRF